MGKQKQNNMTLNKIKEELTKMYPSIYCTGPIHCIALYGPNYNEYWIETNIKPTEHRIIARGRTPRKAWVIAWENKDKYLHEIVGDTSK